MGISKVIRWIRGGKWYYYQDYSKSIPEWNNVPPSSIRVPIIRREAWSWRRPFTKTGMEALKIRASAALHFEEHLSNALKSHDLIKKSYLIKDSLNIDYEAFRRRYIQIHSKTNKPVRYDSILDFICEALEDQNIYIIRHLLHKGDDLYEALVNLYVDLVKGLLVSCVGFGTYDLTKKARDSVK